MGMRARMRVALLEEYGPAPRNGPLSYPGKHPAASFLFCGDRIVDIRTHAGRRIERSDVGGSKLGDISSLRMIAGFGSNPNPTQLQSKFAGIDAEIPILHGTMPDHDVVYASHFASYGALPATLCRSEGTNVSAWVTLLTEGQLIRMDGSESRGVNYDLCEMQTEITLDNGEAFGPVYAYLGKAGVLCLDGRPCRLSGIEAENARYPAADEREILDRVRAEFGLGFCDAESFVSAAAADRRTYNRMLKDHSCGSGLEYNILPPGTYPKAVRNMERFFRS